MLYRLLERIKRSCRADVICFATGTDPANEALVKIAEEAGVQVYCGPLDDVLTRLIDAARVVGADIIAQITGDCPLIDSKIVDAVIDRYLKGGYTLVTNILDHLTFPVGFDVQVYQVSLLEEVSRLTPDPQDHEHVTPFIYRNPQHYRLLNLRAPAELNRPKYRLCVDYEQDFEVVTEVYEALYPSDPAFDAWKIIEFLDKRPDLVAKNDWMEDTFASPSSGGHADQEILWLDRG